MHDKKESEEGLRKINALLDGATPRRRVLVDFDLTLFLSNSTEEFLGSAKPAFLAVFILKILALLRPWFLFSRERGYFVWRDAIRVWTVIILMPWTLFLFKRNAPALFKQYLNQDLAEPLQKAEKDNITIISFGFGFIIRQLIAGSSFARTKLVASSIWHPTLLRQQGKLAYLADNAIQTDPERDIVITDSDKDDADLLTTYNNGIHIHWPNEKTTGAHAGVYMPFYYLAMIKRSPEFFVKSTLLEEFPIFVLAFLLFQPFQWGFMMGGALLFLAFLIVYEIGYHENDHVGARYEENPRLSKEFLLQQSYRVEPYAWYWMVVISVIAIFLLGQEHISESLVHIGLQTEYPAFYGGGILLGLWVFMAILVRLTFFVFNHVPLLWRIFVFFPLHVIKYFSPLVFFSIQPAGFALLIAQVIRTWSAYAIRRCGGDEQVIVSQLVRLMFLIFLLIIFAMLTSFESIFGAWQTWVILAWCVLRTIPEMSRKLLHQDVRTEFVPWTKKGKVFLGHKAGHSDTDRQP